MDRWEEHYRQAAALSRWDSYYGTIEHTPRPIRFLSLFSGIGGFDLGLERAGMECAGQVEIDPFGTSVLQHHWPDTPRWTDVREVTGEEVLRRCGRIDAIAGGFPCQPWSLAGRRLGTEDPRHLWPEYCRLIRQLQPRWVIGENVPGLLSAGADLVLEDLEKENYACWPVVLGADDVGAPHKRKGVFFLARRMADEPSERLERAQWQVLEGAGAGPADGRPFVADTPGGPCSQRHQPAVQRGRTDSPQQAGLGCGRTDVAHADNAGRQERGGSIAVEQEQLASQCGSSGWPGWPAKPGRPQHAWEAQRAVEPAMGLPADGTARRLAGWRNASLKALGNAVVPQVAEAIGRIVVQADRNECLAYQGAQEQT